MPRRSLRIYSSKFNELNSEKKNKILLFFWDISISYLLYT